MGKLFGQIFKEDFKSIILWLFLPLGAVLIFSQLISIFTNSALVGIGLILSTTLLIAGPLVALGILSKNDTQRFYNDNASFYSVLPFNSSEVTAARYINFIVIGIIIAISILINLLILIRTQSTDSIRFTEIFNAIANALSQTDIKTLVGVILTLFTTGLAFAAMIMFADTSGHLKIFGSSKSASAFIFTIIFLAMGYIFAKFQGWLLADYMVTTTSGEFSVEVADQAPYMRTVILPSLFNVIVTAIFYISTFKIHKDKLSVA